MSFYQKRFYRIYIPYLVIYLPYCLIFILLGKYTFGDSLLCLCTLEYWLFHKGAWFVSMILVLYLVAPFLFRLLSGTYKWFIAIGIIIALMILCNIPVSDHSSTSILHNTQWAFGRVPSLILGMAIGSSCKANKQLPLPQVLLFCFVSFVMSVFIGAWKCQWLIVPIIAYIFIFLLKLTKDSWIDKSLKLLGAISLESYLTNITLNSLLRALAPAYFTSPVFYGHYLEYTVVIVAGLLLAYYVHNVAQVTISKLTKWHKYLVV